MNKNHFMIKLYFMLASLAGLMGVVISLGFLLYNLLSYQLISNDIYIYSRHSRELDQCQQAKVINDNILNSTNENPSEEEVADCRIQTMKKLEYSRYGEYLDNIINSSIRLALFSIVFFTHFPMFRKATRDSH